MTCLLKVVKMSIRYQHTVQYGLLSLYLFIVSPRHDCFAVRLLRHPTSLSLSVSLCKVPCCTLSSLSLYTTSAGTVTWLNYSAVSLTLSPLLIVFSAYARLYVCRTLASKRCLSETRKQQQNNKHI